MLTKFIGMKEFRQNMATYTKNTKKGVRYVILKKNVPVLDVRPIDEKQFAFEKLSAELEEAEKDIREGNVYSHEEVLKHLGLN